MRQAATAIAVFHELAPSLHGRQQIVSALVREFRDVCGLWPTSQELLKFAIARHPSAREYDVNSVRPRLHELERAGLVAHGLKRHCTITGKVVMTWELAEPRAAAEDDAVPDAEPRQMGMRFR